jgi:hypothetical protein
MVILTVCRHVEFMFHAINFTKNIISTLVIFHCYFKPYFNTLMIIKPFNISLNPFCCGTFRLLLGYGYFKQCRSNHFYAFSFSCSLESILRIIPMCAFCTYCSVAFQKIFPHFSPHNFWTSGMWNIFGEFLYPLTYVNVNVACQLDWIERSLGNQ